MTDVSSVVLRSPRPWRVVLLVVLSAGVVFGAVRLIHPATTMRPGYVWLIAAQMLVSAAIAARLARIGVIVISPDSVVVRQFLRTSTIARSSIRRVDLDLVWTLFARGINVSHHFSVPTIVTDDGSKIHLNHFKVRQRLETNTPEVIAFVHSLRAQLGLAD